ncbi:MAG: sensor histidine kinase [Pseudonocardiaceae bacterium]|nr:sensor histidine kinase [Pseudonocardiaceae bacterium]
MMRVAGQPRDPGAGVLAHQMLVFDSDDELATVAGSFAAEGVEAGDRVLCVVAGANEAVLREALGAPAAERVQFADAAHWYREPAWALAGCGRCVADHAGAGRVRILGEPTGWRRSLSGVSEWHRVDAAANVVFHDAPLALLCLYDLRQLDAAFVDQARRTHPQSRDAGGTRPNGDYVDPVAFAADCDRDELPQPDWATWCTVTAERLRDSRDLVWEIGLLLGMPEQHIRDLALASYEVAANAVEHGGGIAHQRAWAADGELVCEVRDHGTGIGDAFAGFHPPRTQARQGRGLWLARQLCGLVEIRSDMAGTTVRLHMRR